MDDDTDINGIKLCGHGKVAFVILVDAALLRLITLMR